jgi:hypothetical protein
VHRLEPNPKNLVPPSHYKGVKEKIGTIRYRIAYLAVCLEDSWGGHEIYHGLGEMAKRDPSSAAERKIPVVVCPFRSDRTANPLGNRHLHMIDLDSEIFRRDSVF